MTSLLSLPFGPWATDFLKAEDSLLSCQVGTGSVNIFRGDSFIPNDGSLLDFATSGASQQLVSLESLGLETGRPWGAKTHTQTDATADRGWTTGCCYLLHPAGDVLFLRESG